MYLNKTIILTAISLVLGTSFVNAEPTDLIGPLEKSTAKELFFEPSFGEMFSYYDQGVRGDCSELKTFLEKTDTTTFLRITGELYDRGVCVEYDPRKAFETILQSAQNDDVEAFAILAWKYFKGHGVEKSYEKGNQFFAQFLTQNAGAYSFQKDLFAERVLKDRDLTPQMQNGFKWLNDYFSNDQNFIKFVRALSSGKLEYLDRHIIEPNKRAVNNIFRSEWKRSPFVTHEYAKMLFEGSFSEPNPARAILHMISNAECGYLDASLWLAYHYENDGSYIDAMLWNMIAIKQGDKLKNRISIISEKISSYDLTVATERFAKFNPANRCE